MSLSKYPSQLDLFETKKDAQFDGDPNGDFVMSDDVNALQDAISAIETSLGVNPQGNKLSVGERISLLEGSSALRAPSFLIYLGKPAKINNSDTTLEAAMWFAKFDHIVLGNNAEDPSDTDHASTLEVIGFIRNSKDVKFYGYIDVGVNTFNLSISEIQNQIIQWKDLGASGIYCANYGYEFRVPRERQNQILDSIHQHGMVAILDSADPEQVFTNIYHETMNPNWIEPRIQDGDIYHYNSFALDSSTPNVYESNQLGAIMKLIKLYDYRVNKGIKVFATSVIQSTVPQDLAQQYYDYAHTTALVTSMDAFYPVTEGYAELTNYVPAYSWMPIAGSWYMSSPRIEYDLTTGVAVREVPFGKITLDMFLHTYKYEGIYIPFEVLRIAANSIEGSLLKDATIEDKKIKNYDGKRLISSINADTSTDTIDIKKISTFNYTDINGTIPSDVLKVNVIDAINAHIGTATIDQAFIGDLTASKITAGTIDAERITASVVNALNLYAENAEIGHATISEAVIGNLSAEKITAGSIDAERIKASVVEAINLSADQANIKNLNADNITAGNIKADRIQADVVNAINMYTENMVAGSAVINTASIGEMSAGHIQAAVIDAINLSSDTATIKNAKIGELSADKIVGAVIDAINLNAGHAEIAEAVIGDLSATKITAGTLDADIIKGSVMTAINFNTENAVIDQAKIGNLNADKITAGDISAERLKAGIVDAINLHAETMTADSATISNAAIGALEAKHIKGAVVEAINLSTENAVIQNAKIGTLSVDNMKAAVIAAVNASIETAVIDQANIGDLSAEKIKTGTLDADIIKGSVIEAVNGSFESVTIAAGKIGELEVANLKASVISAINASIESATIDAAQIGSLKAENIQAEVIKAINASIETATIDAAQIGALTADNIKAAVIEAINLSADTATIKSAVIGALTVDNMKGAVVEAVNSYTGSSVIGQARIGDLSASKITSGDIATERLAANVLTAINAKLTNATIDSAVIGSLKSENIQAEIIKAINASIETATIDAAQIGTLAVDNISANVIKAINASLETAVIDSAQIGTLTADHIKGSIIDAINFTTQTAVIEEGKIANLSATKIATGDIAAERMTANAIKAINADLTTATIDSAQIGNLAAEKIEASVIEAINANIGTAHIDKAVIPELDATHIQTNVIEAVNANIVGTARINSAVLGTVTADKIQTNVIEAINANIGTAKIDKAIVPVLDAGHISANVVEAINMKSTTTQIDQARIGNLDAGKITTGDLNADRIRANVVSAINSEFQTAKIDNAKIGVLTAEHIQTSVIEAINARLDNVTINSGKIGVLQVDNLKAAVIAAINASIENATINSAMIGTLAADKIQTNVIAAINANINKATIDQAIIPNLSATKITTGDIAAERMTTNAIKAINADLTTATIDAAQIGVLKAENIQAEVIKAINASIETATIDAANIGSLKAENISAEIVKAINLSGETAQIGAAKIGNLDAAKITSGQIDTNLLTANVVTAINSIAQTAQIAEAKIGNLSASKITAGDIAAARLQANVVSAINTYTQNMVAGSAKIDSAVMGTLSADHMQAKVISAINASIEQINSTNAVINSAKIGVLTADHIKTQVLEAIRLSTESAVIDQAKIGNLDATKIVTGDIAAERMTTNAIKAINADITTATIDAAQIGVLKAENIQAEVIKAINASIETAQIDSANITALDADHIKASVITAINASVENIKIENGMIEELTADHIKASVIEAVNGSIENLKISNAMIESLTADHIKAVVIEAINTTTQTAKIGYAQIGELQAVNIGAGIITADKLATKAVTADKIDAGAITSDKIIAGAITSGKIASEAITSDKIAVGSLRGDRIEVGSLNGDRIQARTLTADILQAGSITATEIAAQAITAREIAAGSITAEKIRAGSITADHISTVGLDAQHITVYDGKTGETLVGSGYLRVDGLDIGVVQSDNLAGNGLFMTSSSEYGFLKKNPHGEAILGSQQRLAGGHQLWKYDLNTGAVISKIDLGGTKPVDVAIDVDGRYAYVTLEGDDLLQQIDLNYDTVTDKSLAMSKGPGRARFLGSALGDHKHFFILGTDPKDVNIPDALMVIDAPPTSINKELYLHHQIPVGNGPFDLVVNHHHHVFVTQSNQGDIAVIDASHVNSLNWKVIRNIPIAPYGTDNYHGGVGMEFGLQEVVGGGAASQYTKDDSAEASSTHVHGGYGTVGTGAYTAQPRGIALSSDEDILYVLDKANNELVVVSISGSAPYNAMSGARTEGNLGDANTAAPGMGDSTDRVPSWLDPSTPLSDPNDSDMVMEDGETMVMSAEDITFTAQMDDMDGMDMSGAAMSGPTTKWVWYRIPIGDSPEFIEVVGDCIVVTLEGSGEVACIHESDILTKLSNDRMYYRDWDEFESMLPIPTFEVHTVYVGARPSSIVPVPNVGAEGMVYVSVTGQNQIVGVDLETHTVISRINTGPSPRGMAISNDGTYLYAVNYGNSSPLSFVFPKGNFIGDPYLGLEGGVEYQGAEYWMPNRSDWVYDADGNVKSSSSVEFRINEPFLNEGGYVKLTTYGVDHQFASIQQDIVNVTNYSNGNNVRDAVRERLKANETRTKFFPSNPWLDGSVKNVVRVHVDELGNEIVTPISSSDYTIEYDAGNYVECILGYIQEDEWIEVDYTYKADVYYKAHNGSILIAIDNASSANFDTKFEIEEYTPKTIVFDNQSTGSFIYKDGDLTKNFTAQEKIDYPNYTGLEYSFFSNDVTSVRSNNRPIESITSSSPIIANTMDPSDTEASKAVDGKYPVNVAFWPWEKSAAGVHEFGVHNNPERFITVDGPGTKWIHLDLGKTYMIAHNDFWLRWDNDSNLPLGREYTYNFNGMGITEVRNYVPRTYINLKMETSEDNINWTTWVENLDWTANWLGKHNGAAAAEIPGVSFGQTNWSGSEAMPARYVRWSCDGWEHRDPDTGAVLGSGTTFDLAHAQVYADWEVETEFARDYAKGLPQASIQVAGGSNPKVEYGTRTPNDRGLIVNGNHSPYEFYDAGTGNVSVKIDLGAARTIDHIRVFHYYLDNRTYNGTKTEISTDGITWTTVFDSAVSGTYMETAAGRLIDLGGERQVRYIRDWLNGSNAELNAGNNRWLGIQAMHKYNPDYTYRFPEGSERAGQNLATNGRAFVSSDIKGAYIQYNINIEFTSWWYMTYIVGPEFGELDIEMPTLMGGSHSLFLEGQYLNNVAHRHIMSFKPGTHKVIIRHKSGKVSLDRIRIEDFQYYTKSSMLISAKESTTAFERYKIVADQAKWFEGVGKQSTEGPYDTVRMNKDTGLPDGSVPLKYRFRVISELNPSSNVPERGIAFMTSAIFETGKLHTHWRMSQSADTIPGNRVQAWDGNQPHKTGIQTFHLANGAVRGSKIMTHSIMDLHISPYARIMESKLQLNHPTHRHGRPIMMPMGDHMMEVGFVDNSSTLDSIEGWGTSGTQNMMARADHTHDDRYILKSGDGSVTSMNVTGSITVGGTVDGVDVSAFKAAYDTHAADAVQHLTSAEHTKLTSVSTGATKVELNVAGDGKIKIDGTVSTVYSHPATDGNLHVPATSTTNSGKFLKAGATAGSLSWAQVAFTDISGTITDTQHGSRSGGTLHANATQTVAGFMSAADKLKIDGVSTGANKVIASATNGYALIDGVDTKIYAHPTGDGNLHVPANGATNANKVLKASSSAGVYSWSQVQWSEISGTFSDTNHGNLSGGALHAAATILTNGFMSSSDKMKLENIQDGAINQTTADNRYLRLSGGTVTGNLVIDSVAATSGIEIGDMSLAETPYMDFHSSGSGNDYDARIIASGGNATVGKGTLTVEAATFAVSGDITVTGTIDGVDISSLKSNYDTSSKVPNPPTTLALTEDGNGVDVRFMLSTSSEVTEYEIWSSVGTNTNYHILGIVTQGDITQGATTYTFTDKSYDRKTTIYYRVYASNNGIRSTALSGSKAVTNTVADPTGLSVVANVDSFDIYYTPPEDKRLAAIEILIDKQSVEANLSETNATVVYRGLGNFFTYKIPTVDLDKFHNVWVRSVTRT